MMVKHFTSSLYIVSFIKKEVKVLLHKHGKLGIWIGVGGHIEENENPAEAALREAEEETGAKVKLIHKDGLIHTNDVIEIPAPQFLVEEYIPTIGNTREHIHMDMIYFGFLKDYRKVHMKEKYRWCTKKDLKKMQLQFEVSRFAQASLDVGRRYHTKMTMWSHNE